MSETSSNKSSGNAGKVAGGVGATILAVVFGIGRYSDDVARVGIRGARPIINNVDNVGNLGVKLAPYADDLGRGTGTGVKVIPGEAPGVFNNLDDVGNAGAVVGTEGSTTPRVGSGNYNNTGEHALDLFQKGAELVPTEDENPEE